ncbi:MAG: YMGG-like glycine zipper-containing protein [Terricaulis sp.]
MRMKLVTAALVGAMALTGCQSTGAGYGAAPRQTQLSQCTRNALIGAGIGAVVGAAAGSSENRGENAALGAAAGGLGTYGVCRYLSAREQQRVENAYYQSLNSGSGVNENWQSDQGAPRSLQVSSPSAAPGYGNECRRVSATVSDPQYGNQQLPPETFCRDASGQWRPA